MLCINLFEVSKLGEYLRFYRVIAELNLLDIILILTYTTSVVIEELSVFCSPADWFNGYSVWTTNIINTIALAGIVFGAYQLLAPEQLRGQFPYPLLALRRNPKTRLLFESLASIPEYNKFNSEFRRALELFVYRVNGLARRKGLLRNRFGAIATPKQFSMFALSRSDKKYAAIEKIVTPLLKDLSATQGAAIELINMEYKKYFEFGYLTGGFLHTYQLAILVALGYSPSEEELELAYMSLYRLRQKDKTYRSIPMMVYQMYEVGTLLSFLIPNLSERKKYLKLLKKFEEKYRYEEQPPNPSETLYTLFFGEDYVPTDKFV